MVEWHAQMTSPLFRLVDANVNRASEGLRVLEELARFSLSDDLLAQELRSLRHELARMTMPMGVDLLSSRDSVRDVGRESGIRVEGEHTLLSTIRANSKRAEESLRVLEELGRLADLENRIDPARVEGLRYSVYDLEKRLSGGISRESRASRIRGLYVVVDRQAMGSRSPVEVASEAIEGGATVIQLRDKVSDRAEVYREAVALNSLCVERDVLFVVNDYADVTMAVGAAGLHVGQRDLPLPVLRRMLPIDTIVGVSCENEEDVARAMAEGADYLAVGAVFPTAQKADHVLVGLDLLSSVCRSIGTTPVVAIGGIGVDNAAEVVRTGAGAIAVIGAVVMQPDVRAAACALAEIIRRNEEAKEL